MDRKIIQLMQTQDNMRLTLDKTGIRTFHKVIALALYDDGDIDLLVEIDGLPELIPNGTGTIVFK